MEVLRKMEIDAKTIMKEMNFLKCIMNKETSENLTLMGHTEDK